MFYYFKSATTTNGVTLDTQVYICKNKESFTAYKDLMCDGKYTFVVSEGTCDFNDKGVLKYKTFDE